MLEKYFRFPFALTGDKDPIPDEVQVSGDVSYQEGYGLDYQLDPGVEPSAKNIERDKYNAVLYDVTKAIQEYQQIGFPYFITSAQNGGVAFEYQKYASVFYDNGVDIKLYRSRIDANTDLPTVSASWQEIGFTSGNNLTITGAVFEGSVSNGEWVYWDNANNRFDEAIADGTAAQNVIGIADVTNGGVVVSGERIGLVSGLVANTAYYLSTVTPGAITSVRPASNAVQVGASRGATSFHVNITAAQALASETVAGVGEIATDAEAQAFTANKLIDGAKLGLVVLGANQTWQNVTASRAPTTIYTNTTGKPIQLYITGDLNDTVITIGGVAMAGRDYTGGSFICVIVPNGDTYSLTAGGSADRKWFELR
jgi:hypothetical protein